MMKSFVTFLFSVLGTFVCAQQNNISIKYTFTERKDPKTLLLVFNDSSSYSVYQKKGWDTNYTSKQQIIADDRKGIMIKVSSYDSIGAIVYRNFNKKEIIFRETKSGILDPFMVKDNWLEIDWTLIDKTKKICGQVCKKAIGTFRGRKYTAWYSTEIKSPAGPWKLFGLPGVILAAEDRDGIAKFMAKEILYSDTTEMVIPQEKLEYSVRQYHEYIFHHEKFLTQKLKSIPTPKGISFGEARSLDTESELRYRALECLFEWETDPEGKRMPTQVGVNKN